MLSVRFKKTALVSASMATKKVGLGPVKRFGVRYGRTTKMRLAAVEVDQKKAQNCPYCKKDKAHRISYGIYVCDQCGKKFTGPAYSLVQTVHVAPETSSAKPAPETEA